MRFVDCVTLRVTAGHGGPGKVAFHREKFVTRGGPSGGNGGRGGSVVLMADENLGTLLDLRFRKLIQAPAGQSGGAKRCDGASGEDHVLRVPVGTIVRDGRTRQILADLTQHGNQATVARGGRGGQGNALFKTAVNQAPRYAQPGEEGEDRWITLELKLLADIGIIGFPSVGKSTLISVISNARPKIAAYPFTTLVPNLGIVQRKDFKSFVVADIPGLIEGAHEGRGLGYKFLRHIERCRALVHLIEVAPGQELFDMVREPIADYDAIQHELAQFSESLAARPQIVALAKMDLPETAEREEELRAYFEARDIPFYAFSAATRQGLDALLDAMVHLVDTAPMPDAAHFTAAEFEIPDDDHDPMPRYTEDGEAMVWDYGNPDGDEEDADESEESDDSEDSDV